MGLPWEGGKWNLKKWDIFIKHHPVFLIRNNFEKWFLGGYLEMGKEGNTFFCCWEATEDFFLFPFPALSRPAKTSWTFLKVFETPWGWFSLLQFILFRLVDPWNWSQRDLFYDVGYLFLGNSQQSLYFDVLFNRFILSHTNSYGIITHCFILIDDSFEDLVYYQRSLIATFSSIDLFRTLPIHMCYNCYFRDRWHYQTGWSFRKVPKGGRWVGGVSFSI